MKKTILYRLLGIGSVPKKLRPVLEREGVVVLDEGIGGWFVTKHVNGPGKRYRHRTEGKVVEPKASEKKLQLGKVHTNAEPEPCSPA